MKLTDDLGDLSPRGKATLLGAMALCCVVPMLVVFGLVSLTGALFGGTALVVVGALAVLGWGVWSGRHHRHMHNRADGEQHDSGSPEGHHDAADQTSRTS